MDFNNLSISQDFEIAKGRIIGILLIGQDVLGVDAHLLQHLGQFHIGFAAINILRFLNPLSFLHLVIHLHLLLNVTGDFLIYAIGFLLFHHSLSVDLSFDRCLSAGALADLFIVLIALSERLHLFAYFYFLLLEHLQHLVELLAASNQSYSMVLKG